MNRFFVWVIVFLSFSLDAYAYMMRVLISDEGASATLKSDGFFMLSDMQKGRRRERLKGSSVSCFVRDGALYLNGKRVVTSGVHLESSTGRIEYAGCIYYGTFLIVYEQERLMLINRIELEQYVASGLRWEMLPSWPAAALEAGAIAYRTKAIAASRQARAKNRKNKKNGWYDIRCTSLHQVYKGSHDCVAVHAAVEKTAGLVLVHKGTPIDALYDICCGGTIPAGQSGVDFKKAPYLARTVACMYCKECRYYRWSAHYSLHTFKARLHEYLGQASVHEVRVGEKDMAGCVHTIYVQQKGERKVVPAAVVKKALKELRSATYTITQVRHGLQIKGKGYGHQLGLCQYGARGCALKGWDAKRILSFYYPGTTLMKVVG